MKELIIIGFRSRQEILEFVEILSQKGKQKYAVSLRLELLVKSAISRLLRFSSKSLRFKKEK